jgi:hypothetical protein
MQARPQRPLLMTRKAHAALQHDIGNYTKTNNYRRFLILLLLCCAFRPPLCGNRPSFSVCPHMPMAPKTPNAITGAARIAAATGLL